MAPRPARSPNLKLWAIKQQDSRFERGRDGAQVNSWLADFARIDEVRRGAAGERAVALMANADDAVKVYFERSSSSRDRAVWLFAEHPVLFQRASEARFLEHAFDNAAVWSPFETGEFGNLPKDFKERVETAFAGALDRLLADSEGGGHRTGRVRIWKRPDVTDSDELRDRGGYQITIDRARLSEIKPQDKGGVIQDLPVKLTDKVGLVFEPNRLMLDVVVDHGGVDLREEIARCFCEHVLGIDVISAPPKLKLFQLDKLAIRQTFAVPSEIPIDDVRIVWMRMMWPGANEPIIDLRPRSSSKSADYWLVASRRLKHATPDRIERAIVLQAKLQIDFSSRPDIGAHSRTVRLDRNGRSSLRHLVGRDRDAAEKLIDAIGLRITSVHGLTNAVRVLGALFESLPEDASIDELRETFGDLIDHPLVQRCFKSGRRASSVPCPNCDEPHSVVWHPPNYSAAVAAYCPDVGWFSLSPAQLDTVTFDQAAWLSMISRAFGVDGHSGREILSNRVWSLGEVAHDERVWIAIVARDLDTADVQAQLRTQFLARPLKAPAILLTAHAPILLTAFDTHLAIAEFGDVINPTSDDVEPEWDTVSQLLKKNAVRKGRKGRRPGLRSEVWREIDQRFPDGVENLTEDQILKVVRSKFASTRPYRIAKAIRQGRPD